VAFAFQTNRDCDVTLVDVGTSGQVAVILPNAWRASARVAGGRPHLFPGPDFPDFEYTLAPPAGRERVIAIASLVPLPPLGPEGDAPFRVLGPAEIDGLAGALAAADPAAWALCGCEFAIDPGE
jgi:hypothetical protein